MKQWLLSALLFAAVLLSGCVGQTPTENRELAISACVEARRAALDAGKDLSKGPCLSNSVVEGWVCDVAHSPREAVDNEPENQCSAYREGKITHFVEVDPSCNLIRAV